MANEKRLLKAFEIRIFQITPPKNSKCNILIKLYRTFVVSLNFIVVILLSVVKYLLLFQMFINYFSF